MDSKLLYSIFKHYIVFLTTIVCFLALGVGINYIVEPEYEAKATLVANFGQADDNIDNKYNEILANQMLTKTYSEVIQSLYIAKIVKDKLNSPLSANDLLKKVQVKTDPGALILTVIVRDTDPVAANNIANSFAESFAVNSKEIVHQTNVTILDLASNDAAPTPVSPKKAFNLALCLFTGLFLGSSICLLMDKKRVGRFRKTEYKYPVNDRSALITEERRA